MKNLPVWKKDPETLITLTLRVGAYGSFVLVTAAFVLAALVPGYDAEPVSRAGVLLLLATPVLRILATMVIFAMQRDWKYLSISTGVLCIVAGATAFGFWLH